MHKSSHTDIPVLKSRSIQQDFIHKFKSTLSTVENRSGGSVQTNHETTYHTFDYENMKVVVKSYNRSEGQWERVSYKMKLFYKENQWDYVIVCDDKVMKEIWFSPATNEIGYDLHDGIRLIYYEVKRIR